ncbi:Microfibrillar-associated protein 1 [Orchesella cincta]|uniref:Microfibrillar-associated protein 1 n=1 Tax=Orchesella cincta TaxID=48709 RepID=A0A1D2MCN2_ORCCI|nr:Microfibrillar-associated protein 1 [Orchesella cincta]
MCDNHHEGQLGAHQGSIHSTAGAIPVKNEKGELSMQKVKVTRYVSGKRPEYAPSGDQTSSSEDEEGFVDRRKPAVYEDSEWNHDNFELKQKLDLSEHENSDTRLRRLKRMIESGSLSRARRVEEPEVLEGDGEDEWDRRRHYESDSDSNGEEEVVDEEEADHRRACIRNRVLKIHEQEKLLKKEDDNKEESDPLSDSEYEEETDSEEVEPAFPLLKPVFVKKSERQTVADKGSGASTLETPEQQKKQNARRKETLKLIEMEIQQRRRRKSGEKGTGNEGEQDATTHKLSDVNTDEEPDEADYEAWKVRELKRMKRDREERAAYEREKMELKRIRNLTEEERRLHLKLRPKQITNKAEKGKYRFLQKFYHRGAFYLDQEEEILKRDVSEPTLEDHFDKTMLPQVMQVKSFGRNGRTKYTHLTDQDTSDFDCGWMEDIQHKWKFHFDKAAGVRQVFEKPSLKSSKSVRGDDSSRK